MERAARSIFAYLPLMFGLGFIAPLIAQAMIAWHLVPPLGISPVAFGLAIGGTWGFYANLRGRWL